jgi:putative transposase
MSTKCTRGSCPTAVKNVSHWPTVDFQKLDQQERNRAEKYKDLITRYLAGETMRPLLQATGVSHHAMLHQFNRCIRTAPDGRLYGWRALLKNLHVEEYVVSHVDPTQPRPENQAGQFQALQRRFPDVAMVLKNLIIGKGKGGQPREHRIKVKDLQQRWFKELLAKGVTLDQYPFKTAYGGYRTLAKHVKTVIARDLRHGVREQHGDDAAMRLNVLNGHEQNIRAEAPFDVVQIDAHKCDFLGAVGIPTPKGIRWIVIERVWVIIVVDVFTRLILGYSLSFRTEVRTADVLRAISDALAKHSKLELTTKGLQYEPGSGFASAEFPEIVGAGWGLLLVDNALVHLSNAVLNCAQDRIGCAVNFGPVAHWMRRSDVERIFGAIESAGFSRLHSTVGKSPTDPLAKNASKRALEAKLHATTIAEITDTILSSYNSEISEGNGFASPLQMVQFAIRENNPVCLPMPISLTPEDLSLTSVRETRRLAGNLKKGIRPHITIDRVMYTNALLSSATQYVGTELSLIIDEERMRCVRAFLPDGSDLGVLTAVGKWSRTEHTRSMRKIVNSLIAKKYLNLTPGEDPITGLQYYLAHEAMEQTKGKPRNISRAATKLVEVGLKSGTDVPYVLDSGGVPPPPLPPVTVQARSRRLISPKAIY